MHPPLIENEIWKAVPNFNFYEVSNTGKVRSIVRLVNSRRGNFVKKQKVLKPSDDQKGYLQVVLYKSDGKTTKSYKVHKLVALVFVPNPLNKETVNHIDGIKANNFSSNLEWNTRSENTQHKFAIGLHDVRGEKHPCVKLTEKDVLAIRSIGKSDKATRDMLAKKYNVTASYLWQLMNRRSWKHV